MSISCNLLFFKVVNFKLALFNKASWLSVVVLYTNLKALSCRRSNLRLSDALPKKKKKLHYLSPYSVDVNKCVWNFIIYTFLTRIIVLSKTACHSPASLPPSNPYQLHTSSLNFYLPVYTYFN